MADVQTVSSTTTVDAVERVDRSAAFWTYLVIFILSISCSLFIFCQFIRKPAARTKINNHIILAVVICSFLQVITEVPLILIYFWTNAVLISSDLFCTIWCYIDYVFNVVILMLICYGSIQRYLLVFHSHFIQRHVILFHYAPMVFCLVYPNLLYVGLIVLYPCVKQYDYTKVTCQGPCYLFERLSGSVDLLVNLTLPLSLCVLANFILLIRVLHQKHRMKQQRKWKKNRHLVIQLLSIVIVHNLIWLPIIICLLTTLFSPSVDQTLIDLSVNLFTYSIYIVIMICPFVALLGLPDLRPRRQQLIPRWFRPDGRRRTVHATTVPLQVRSKSDRT